MGQTVVVKLHFVNCPLANIVCPYLQGGIFNLTQVPLDKFSELQRFLVTDKMTSGTEAQEVIKVPADGTEFAGINMGALKPLKFDRAALIANATTSNDNGTDFIEFIGQGFL